ncbi:MULTISPECIES: GNAT family N-acetyltransferase [unclassified Roseovarius]|uniref:GNAT family N-acetyltransferase n=1 Tax=unclassified Roseovarius TaxID=2614913 RepID=UPI0027401C3F|nr:MULTISPECIES: N-acetyltransferase [unclassified Roseovarius]
MENSTEYKAHAAAITDLFTATFTTSEGVEEGALIGELTCRLMAETPLQDLRVFTAWNGGELDSAIIFSRLIFESDNRTVFVLGPVAVATNRQGQNIGQRLITHGLEALRTEGVDLVVTYGDPNFYKRIGFSAITEEDVPAPFPLQYPEGWLGQSLDDMPLTPLNGPSRCVPAFNDPVFW